MSRRGLLYMSGTLPARSETFVYREVLGLRARGWPMTVASVHAPERNLGDDRVDALADEAVPVYAAGKGALVRDALKEFGRRPLRTLATAVLGLGDALTGGDVPMSRRPKVLWQCCAGIALAGRVHGREIAHVHAHMAHVPATIAMYAARQLGVPFSMTGHAVDIFRERTLLTRKLGRAAFTACISTWHRQFYGEIHAASDDRYPIVRCGVDPDDFAPGPRGDDVTMLAVGRLVPKKGFDVLLEALARVEDASVEIVGDGPERDALERLAKDAGVADRVTFAGAVDNHEVRDRMQHATIMALPCKVDPDGDRDGIPVVLMEAMACGACVVSGDLPAIRELVIHDETGIMVPPGDVDALAAALQRLAADPELRNRLAAAGREHVRREFSSRVNLDRIENAFGSISGGGRSAPCAATS